MSRTKHLLFECLLVGSIGIFSVIPAAAQEGRGLIIGQVTDPRGAIIPIATVTAVRGGTQQNYTAQTSSGGDFSIPYLLPGVYVVTVEAPGFKKALRTGVTVDVAGKVNLNISLEVGSVTETVTVQSETSLLNTADASGGTVIDPDRVQNLPLNGRQIYTLLDLTPGVKFTQGSHAVLRRCRLHGPRRAQKAAVHTCQLLVAAGGANRARGRVETCRVPAGGT